MFDRPPNQPPDADRAFQRGVIGFVVALAILWPSYSVYRFYHPKPKKAEPAEQREHSEMSYEIEARTKCQIAMKNRLVSPSTAKFPGGMFESSGQITRTVGRRYTLRSHVDSQNAFGATLRTRFVCVVQFSGNQATQFPQGRIVSLEFE